MNPELVSNAALVGSVVVYLLAMSSHAAEWAAARRVGAADVAASEPELVPAAAVAATSSTPTSSQSAARSGEPVDRAEPGSAEDLPRADRVDLFGRIGISLTIVGFALSLVGVVARGVAAGRAPWGNMFEFTISAMVFVVAVYLVLLLRSNARWLGLPVTLLATIGNGLAVTVFYVAVAPFVPALHSVWFVIHIVAAAIAGAAFNLGGIASVLYLLRHRAERRGHVAGYLSRVPDARRLDLLSYRCHAFAFPLWTFTVVAGAIWAEYAWGRYWGWDPKETWALVTWIIYACYLHARATAGWKGTRAAVVAIIGVASFWFNFIGINLLVSGLHSYAGV
jgi:cytochrome c-type biogenesis protein CcsB